MKSVSRGVYFSDFRLLLWTFTENYVNPINALCPQCGQAHAKDL